MQISVCLNSRLVATETEFAETLHGSHSQQHNGNQQHFRLHMATILQKLFLSLHTVWLQILISCGLAWQQQLCFILYHTAFLLAHALHHFLWFVGAIYGSAHWQSSSTNWMVFTVDTETFFPCLIPKQRKAAVCTVIFVSSLTPSQRMVSLLKSYHQHCLLPVLLSTDTLGCGRGQIGSWQGAGSWNRLSHEAQRDSGSP